MLSFCALFSLSSFLFPGFFLLSLTSGGTRTSSGHSCPLSSLLYLFPLDPVFVGLRLFSKSISLSPDTGLSLVSLSLKLVSVWLAIEERNGSLRLCVSLCSAYRHTVDCGSVCCCNEDVEACRNSVLHRDMTWRDLSPFKDELIRASHLAAMAYKAWRGQVIP